MIGQRINNYEIVQLIGEGGMGSVYMARHPFIDRKVAIKVLRASLANDPAVVGRFFNEAKAASAIHHPNIIEILDVGLLPDGRTPYLMMELLEGENVSARIKRGLLSPQEAVMIALETASAVSAAHAQGIVHRDLKPENLFLARDSHTGKESVKVLDFGIAKLRGPLSGDGVRTQTGALMGTPPYMSPEQCRGISGEVDHRTDVYALGIILYEMLCGSPPFVGEGFGDVLVQHLTRAPDPPRSRNPIIPGSLERVIMRALRKTAVQRYL
ncbi:MAG TPA: serine/threonine-protein kinase, partial [Polyangia bacterium]|nr:serine/threonine-protein kinase [Polyangia bacterium]